MLIILLFLICICFFSSSLSPPAMISDNFQNDHLVVLAHGLMGGPTDLSYLANALKERGCIVLTSRANEKLRTLDGVQRGGMNLASEIMEFKQKHPQLTKISLVGNSLGGLFARYAIKILHDKVDKTVAGLTPECFMTIATPHLGVHDFTFADDFGIPLPSALKRAVARTLLTTGEDLFAIHPDSDESCLLYQMAVHSDFLQPLAAFRKRRAYGNLNMDFVVPLGTAVFLSPRQVDQLRTKHRRQFGIVEFLDTTGSPSTGEEKEEEITVGKSARMLKEMRTGLDRVGWEKIIVHFDLTDLLGVPLAHNRICALKKYTDLFDRLLGFHKGQHVMDQAAQWLTRSATQSVGEGSQEGEIGKNEKMDLGF